MRGKNIKVISLLNTEILSVVCRLNGTLLFDSLLTVQFSSVAQLCPTLCNPMNRSTPGLRVHHQLPESTQTMSIESVMPSNHLILSRPLLLLPSIFPSIRVFSNESALRIRCLKYWSFSISPSNKSVQFSHSVVSDSLRPHESQHTRPPCPSPTPGVHSNSCPSNR